MIPTGPHLSRHHSSPVIPGFYKLYDGDQKTQPPRKGQDYSPWPDHFSITCSVNQLNIGCPHVSLAASHLFRNLPVRKRCTNWVAGQAKIKRLFPNLEICWFA